MRVKHTHTPTPSETVEVELSVELDLAAPHSGGNGVPESNLQTIRRARRELEKAMEQAVAFLDLYEAQQRDARARAGMRVSAQTEVV